MAILATIDTDIGTTQEVYIRINNIDSVNNHGVECNALIRAFISEAAFDAGKGYIWERMVSFIPDVTGNIWSQAYDALKASLTSPSDPLATTITGAAKDVL